MTVPEVYRLLGIGHGNYTSSQNDTIYYTDYGTEVQIKWAYNGNYRDYEDYYVEDFLEKTISANCNSNLQ